MFVFHIGLRKSGSASIQTFLAANQDALRALSIDYAKAGRGKRKDHHNIVRDVTGSFRFKSRQGSLEQLAQEAANPDMTRVIVSSELFEGFGAAHVAAVKASLDEAVSDFRIVLVLRDLLGLIPSSYAQKIRYGLRLFDFDTFFEERMQEDRVDYFETASRWADVFGWDALKVRPLDPRYLKNGDLIDDFLDALDIDVSDPRIRALERPGLVNAALGWKTLEALRALHLGRHQLPRDHPLVSGGVAANHRQQGEAIEEAARKVGDDMNWNTDRGMYFTHDQAELVLETYSTAITALNARLPVALPAPASLDERGFVEREFLPDVSRIPSDELNAFYDALAGFMVDGKFGPTTRETQRADFRAQRKAQHKAERKRERAGG